MSDQSELLEKRKNMICRLVEDEMYVPMKEKELAVFLQVSKEERDELKKVLDQLLMEGKLRRGNAGIHIRQTA